MNKDQIMRVIKEAAEKGERANFNGSDFSRSDLTNINFSGSDLTDVNFSGSNFGGSNFKGADLTYVNFSRAELMRADFSGSDLTGSDFSRADLTDANFSRAVLHNVIGNNREVFTLHISKWVLVYVPSISVLQIGYEGHTVEEWRQFSDESISKMSPDALEFWKRNKDFIFLWVDQVKRNIS